MSRRQSVTNIFPIVIVPEQASQPEESKTRRPSVAMKPNDDNPKDKRSSAQECQPAPLKIEPQIRRVSTAGTPLTQFEEANKRRASQHVSPNLENFRRPPERQRNKSSVTPPNIHQLQVPNTYNPMSRRRNSTALSLNELRSIKVELKLIESIPKTQETLTSADDVRKLHSILKESFSGKKAFEMAFQPRRRGDSIKSRDSGMSTSSGETDENVVEEWKPRWQISKAGSAPGEIKNIKGICFMENGKVAVTEEKNSRIQIFDKKRGGSVKLLDDSSVSRKMQPAGICQLPSRTFLAVTDLKQILYFEPLSYGLCEWKTFDKHSHLHGIAVNSREHLLLTDLEKKRAYSYDISGTHILTFKPDDFLRPEYVAVSEEYSIVFVSDSEQGCVYMLNMDGELLNKIGRQGNDQEKLVYPMGVCCLPNGKLIVADRAQHRLSTYDFRARCYEHPLTRDDLLYSPTCIATDGNRYLAVAEENHDFKVDEYKLKMFYSSRK